MCVGASPGTLGWAAVINVTNEQGLWEPILGADPSLHSLSPTPAPHLHVTNVQETLDKLKNKEWLLKDSLVSFKP